MTGKLTNSVVSSVRSARRSGQEAAVPLEAATGDVEAMRGRDQASSNEVHATGGTR